MRQLSEDTQALIARLYRPPAPGEGTMWRVDLAVVSELANCCEPGAIRCLVPTLAHGTRDEVTAVARAMERLLSAVWPEDLIWLDEWMRGSWVFADRYGEHWRRLNPKELANWVGPGEPGVLLLRLSSCHANGFVREEAVRRLSLLHDGSELPYLLLRLNDWVSPVRQAAQAAIEERLTADYADHFARNLALVVRLEQAKRNDHRELVAAISGLLTRGTGREALTAAMAGGSKAFRRAAFRLLVAGEPEDLEQRLLLGLQMEDPVIRLWSFQKAVAVLDREPLQAVAETLLSADRSALVRREALATWATAFPEQAAEKLMAALLDPSAAVRAQARHHLRERGSSDFAQFYRDALGSSIAPRLVVAISGLAETGTRADAATLVPYLSHGSARVRRAAVRSIMHLGGDEYINLVWERIADQSSGVSTQARKVLQPYAATMGGPLLWDRFRAPTPAHVRRNLLVLMAALPKWESIRYLVRAAGDHDEEIASMARAYVRSWNAHYNRSQSAPTHEQIAQLAAALKQSEAHLDPQDAAMIRMVVRLL